MARLRPLTPLLLLALGTACAQTAPPVQPIAFSHQTHIDAKLTCTDCHTEPAKFGDLVGLPDAPKCLECHAYSTKETSTKATLNTFADKKTRIPWIRTVALKDFVYFDHRFHLLNGAECENCHGPGGSQDKVADRANATKMLTCQPCHVKTGARTACNTCHEQR